jgi:hypothetical protein
MVVATVYGFGADETLNHVVEALELSAQFRIQCKEIFRSEMTPIKHTHRVTFLKIIYKSIV